VFGNGVLRKIFEPNRYVVTGEWGRLYMERLHDRFPTTIIQVMKYRTEGWAVHLACMGDRRGACGVLKGET